MTIKSKSHSVQIPGKLYLLGEYGVVYPDQSAIILAVDRYLKVTIKEAESFLLTSSYLGNESILFSVFAGKVDIQSSKDTRFIQYALQTAFEYLKITKIPYFSVHIESDLSQGYQRKIGLGSSGAITVGILKAVLEFFGQTLDPQALAKLAILCQMDFFPHSSYGDVVCSSLRGIVYYQRGSIETLAKLRSEVSLEELVHQPWSGWIFERLQVLLPKMLVIDSKERSSSEVLVKEVSKIQSTPFFKEFLLTSKQLVEQGKSALEHHQTETFMLIVDNYRRLLHELQEHSGASILTNDMSELVHQLIRLSSHVKTSGAGGGDCLISFYKTQAQMDVASNWLNSHHYETLILKEAKYEPKR